MHLGIRGKLVGTLMLAGLLPLALSLVAGVLAVQQVRMQFAGQSFRALAQQHAEHLSTILVAQMDFFRLLGHMPATVAYLESASTKPAPTPAEINHIEARWHHLDANDPFLRTILNNKIAQHWRMIQQQRPRIAQALITDRYGRLVAATSKPSDYFQADESWWQACWANGRGAIVLADDRQDPSAQPRDNQPPTQGANLCIPIYAPQASGEQRQIVGIVKVSLTADWLLEELRGAALAQRNGLGNEVWLIREDGHVMTGPSGKPEELSEALKEAIDSMPDGYIIGHPIADRDVIGIARVAFPRNELKAPQDWMVVVSGPLEKAMASTQSMLWTVLLVGAIIILCCFVAGLWIARRELIRPLLTLRQGARMLEEGHLGFRLKDPSEPGSVFRHDEIGELARDFNHMAAELEKSIGELAKANRLKQQFIDLASHELRTPITYILGATELAQRQDSPEAPLLARIGVKAQRLNRIVGNMFKLLRSGLFESTLNLGSVDVENLVQAAVHEVEPFLKARGQKLELTLPGGLEPISADAEKLRDILNNLLTNAIRFSPDGTTVAVEVFDRETAIEFVVSDSGPGIPPEELPYVFEPFFRGQSSMAFHTSGEFEHMTRGIGLGLSVVKRFTELHGGTVWAESTPQGARFHVLLPKHPTAETGEPPPPKDLTQPHAAAPTGGR